MLFIVTMISVNMLSAEKICWKLVILILSLLANVVQLCLVAAELLLEFLFDITSLVIGKCGLILRFAGQSQYIICIVSEFYIV